MEKERTEVAEQLVSMGREVEKKIFKGEEVFLGEAERVWAKGLVERSGVDLGKIEGKAMLGEQATDLVEALGKEKAIGFVKDMVLGMLETGGNVFGKGNTGNVEEVGRFVEEYMLEQTNRKDFVFDPKKYKGDGTAGSNWKMNTVYRIEAVMSATNKLMLILGAENENKAKELQASVEVSKHLRERVLRGLERSGEVLDTDLPRGELKDQIIRFLPKGGLSKILEYLVEGK